MTPNVQPSRCGPKNPKLRLRMMRFTLWVHEQLPRVPSVHDIQKKFHTDHETAASWLDDWALLRGELPQ